MASEHEATHQAPKLPIATLALRAAVEARKLIDDPNHSDAAIQELMRHVRSPERSSHADFAYKEHLSPSEILVYQRALNAPKSTQEIFRAMKDFAANLELGVSEKSPEALSTAADQCLRLSRELSNLAQTRIREERPSR